MKTLVPDYYDRFACIAGACRHSCCIGWEIDIDDESLSRFRSLPGAIGKRLAANIECGAAGANFRLDAQERCPFLNADGLCDLILELGADSLCQICADHPRFRNIFSDHVEMGLGLCCEAAGKLILSRNEPFVWRVLNDDGVEATPTEDEAALLRLRDEIASALQDRSQSMDARLRKMFRIVCMPVPRFSLPDWAQFLLTLEQLDPTWGERMHALSKGHPSTFPCTPMLQTPFEQLALYLLMRHLPGALEDEDIRGRITLIALVLYLINALCAAQLALRGNLTLDDLVDIVRMYSSEIEYSDENFYAILDELHRVFPEMDE